MPFSCCVMYCRSNKGSGPKVSMFSFPLKEPELTKLWLAEIKRKNFTPSVHSRVCELHFRDDQIERKTRFNIEETGRHLEVPLERPRLKKGAIPCKLLDRPYILPKNENSDLEIIPEVSSQLQNKKLTLDSIIESFQETDPWVIKKTENYVSFVYIKEDPLPNVQAIAFINSDLELCFYCDSLEVKSLRFANQTCFKFPIVCTTVDDLRLTLTKLASYIETRQKKRERVVSKNAMVLPFTPFQLRKRKRKLIES